MKNEAIPDSSDSTGISQEIMHEIMYYEKQYSKKPALLILVDPTIKDKFFSEQYAFIMNSPNDDINFKQPGYFFGVKFLWKNVHSYGGSARWMLVGDE